MHWRLSHGSLLWLPSLPDASALHRLDRQQHGQGGTPQYGKDPAVNRTLAALYALAARILGIQPGVVISDAVFRVDVTATRAAGWSTLYVPAADILQCGLRTPTHRRLPRGRGPHPLLKRRLMGGNAVRVAEVRPCSVAWGDVPSHRVSSAHPFKKNHMHPFGASQPLPGPYPYLVFTFTCECVCVPALVNRIFLTPFR